MATAFLNWEFLAHSRISKNCQGDEAVGRDNNHIKNQDFFQRIWTVCPPCSTCPCISISRGLWGHWHQPLPLKSWVNLHREASVSVWNTPVQAVTRSILYFDSNVRTYEVCCGFPHTACVSSLFLLAGQHWAQGPLGKKWWKIPMCWKCLETHRNLSQVLLHTISVLCESPFPEKPGCLLPTGLAGVSVGLCPWSPVVQIRYAKTCYIPFCSKKTTAFNSLPTPSPMQPLSLHCLPCWWTLLSGRWVPSQHSDHLKSELLRAAHLKMHFHFWVPCIRLGGELPRHKGTANELLKVS